MAIWDKSNSKLDKQNPESELSEEKSMPPAVSAEESKIIPAKAEAVQAPKPAESPVNKTVIISNMDAYITERMSQQPQTVEELELRPSAIYTGRSRLALPQCFERDSYDCTIGNGCGIHNKDDKGKVLNPGRFIFRWIGKNKRSLDEHLNIRNWVLVNRTYFSHAPRHLWSANGGVEEGDAILAFMPTRQALAIRNAPGEKSRELLRSRMKPGKKVGTVVMTAAQDNGSYYEPQLSAKEEDEATESQEVAIT